MEWNLNLDTVYHSLSNLEAMSLFASGNPLTNWLMGLGGVLWRIFQIALGLGFVIFVHELGHFSSRQVFWGEVREVLRRLRRSHSHRSHSSSSDPWQSSMG